MPTYVYECRVCGKGFEVEQRITEASLTDCDCGAKGGLRRVIQPVAVSFKGAGFHINDYSPTGGGEPAPKPDTKPEDAPIPPAPTPEPPATPSST